MCDEVRDPLRVRGGQLEGDDTAAAAGEEVKLFVTESESIRNGEEVAGLLSWVEVEE